LMRILERAMALPDQTTFPLESMSPADRALAARQLYRPVPELDDAEDPSRLERAIAECVQRVRVTAVERRLAEVRREKRRAADDGRAADVERLAEQLQALSAERQRIRVEVAGV
jgi:hypothetical protein